MIRPIIPEIATTRKDIDIFSGWLNRLENPDPVLSSESKGKGIKLYDEVARDAHAGAVIQTRFLSVSGCEWEILPAESPARKGRPAAQSKEQKIADAVRAILLKTNFSQMVQEIMQAVLYGYYVIEVMWRSDGTTVAPSRFISKHPRRFAFTMDRELRLLTMQNMLDGEILPDKKFICFTWGDSDNPYGRGLGQKLWWPVWFKKNGIKFWMVYLEKFGMPTTVGKYPPGTDKAQQQALLEAIDAIHSETGIKIPDTMVIELLEATRAGVATYEAMCEYMDRQISKAVLGQTLTTEVDGKGSYAASNTHNDVRRDILKSDADQLAELLNCTLVKWITEYNFGPDVDPPKLWFRTNPEEDLKPLADRDKILAVDINLPISKQYFYDTFGIPAPEEGEELVNPTAGKPAGPPDQIDRDDKKPKQFAEKVTPLPSSDQLAQVAAGMTQPELDALLSPLRTRLEGAMSFEEMADHIYDRYPQMEPARFQQLLGRAMFVSGVIGAVDAG